MPVESRTDQQPVLDLMDVAEVGQDQLGVVPQLRAVFLEAASYSASPRGLTQATQALRLVGIPGFSQPD